MYNLARRILSSISISIAAVFLIALPSFVQAAASTSQQDLPENGRVRIINRLGEVRIETWDGTKVEIEASGAGADTSKSPFSIQKSADQLLITVTVPASRVKNPPRVDLRLRLPLNARASVITAGGDVIVMSFPRELNVLTRSGKIVATVPGDSNAEVRALSLKGTAESTLSGAATISSNTTGAVGTGVFHVRVGNGSSAVEFRTTSGAISLASNGQTAGSARPAASEVTAAERPRTARLITPNRPPVLDEDIQSVPAVGTPAPAKAEQDVDEGEIVRVDTQLVTTNISVVDRETNRGVQNLSQKDFKVLENGKPQPIVSFSSSNEPFNLILLIDLSGSTKEVVALIRQAALRFVDAARSKDRIGVITFANTPIIVSTLTEDRELLRQRINAIEEPKGSTKLYDSVKAAIDEVAKERSGTRRNAIVLMSDGLDSTLPNVTGEGSTIPYKDLVNEVSEFDGVLYSLWLDTEYEALSPEDVQPETVDLAHDRMKELSDAGGGVFYEVEKLQDLAGAYEQVVADLGTVYSIGYRPQENVRDGKWRTIRVDIDKPNTVARGKRGYYAR